MTSGENKLSALVIGLKPTLQTEAYCYATVALDTELQLKPNVLCRFVEGQEVTLILPIVEAQRLALDYEYPCRCITLAIHSSLEAVGFLAVITKALADADVSCNVVSAYYHDHLFIREDQVETAMMALEALPAQYKT